MICFAPADEMVWTCRVQQRLHFSSAQAKCSCTEKIRQDEEKEKYILFEPYHEKTNILHMRKQAQISFAVNAKLIKSYNCYTNSKIPLSKSEISSL